MQSFPNPNNATHTNSLSLQAGLVKYEFKKQTPEKAYIKLTLCVIGSAELKRVNPDQPAPKGVVTMINFPTLNCTHFIKFCNELMLKI